MNRISQTSRQTRINRRIHKWISIPFAIFLLLISVTAILLAWKKELNLIPKTQQTRVDLPDGEWISLNTMISIGQTFMQDSLGKSSDLDRIDVRPDKGIAKILFKGHFTELQLDGYTGEVLSVSQRNSDLIEKIHDGSILDFLMESELENGKLIYSTLTSAVLILLCFTGFFLWYNPKKIKNLKNRQNRISEDAEVKTR
jgi:uncharacterized iron-regulated membrane protein